MIRLLVLALAAILAAPALAGDPPRNVIFFIGDGMGPSQVTLGRLVKGAPLAVDAITQTALVLNDSLDGVTDSAAAATALASGVKTHNKRIGVDGAAKPVRSIAEDLATKGYAIGIVTTARITHATPAAFYAHAEDREREVEIAKQLLAATFVTYAAGGGEKHFRKEGRTPAALAGEGRGLVFHAPDHMAGDIDRAATKEPSLAEMTRESIRRLGELAPGKPFFLMVEGARIDHAGHGHDAPSLAREMIAFDDAVAAGLEWAAKDGKTLVLVTGDHATGGLAISEVTDLAGIRRVKASAWRMLQLADGDAEKLGATVRDLAGLELSEDQLEDAIADRHKYSRGGSLAKLISRKLGVHFAFPLDVQDGFHSTEGHDTTMLPLYAAGPGAERFGGTIDNTEIPKRIRELLK